MNLANQLIAMTEKKLIKKYPLLIKNAIRLSKLCMEMKLFFQVKIVSFF